MVRIYKHHHFEKWAKSEKLTDYELKKAVREMEGGMYNVSLGGGLYKKRIAMPGKGKRGGYRTLTVVENVAGVK